METNLYIFSDGKAHSMNEHRYESELDLQQIIADNPELLLRESGNRLMLVSREFVVQEADDSSNAYFLDHLFLDQAGTPVLVEVKRSTDTRIRREVVGQMLDYASRARRWPVSEIKDAFFASNPDAKDSDEYQSDDFWQRVGANLKAEHMRLVFAADHIPGTLRTLIEFLDRTMDSIEVYGVEIRQFKTDDACLLTANIIEGIPLQEKREPQIGIRWDADSFSSFLMKNGMGESASAVDELRQVSETIGLDWYFGRGAKLPTVTVKKGAFKLFVVSPWEYSDNGYKCPIDFKYSDISNILPDWTKQRVIEAFTTLSDREALYKKHLIWESEQYLHIDVSVLTDSGRMASFMQSLQEMCDEITE